MCPWETCCCSCFWRNLVIFLLCWIWAFFWNFYCTIEREPLLDSFPSVFLTSENQAINEMPKGKRYFKVVEDKARYQKKGSKGENEGCATKLVGEKKNLSGFQGQIGWKSGWMNQLNTYWRFIRRIGRRWGKGFWTMIRITGRAERKRNVSCQRKSRVCTGWTSNSTSDPQLLTSTECSRLMHSKWMWTKDVQRC